MILIFKKFCFVFLIFRHSTCNGRVGASLFKSNLLTVSRNPNFPQVLPRPCGSRKYENRNVVNGILNQKRWGTIMRMHKIYSTHANAHKYTEENVITLKTCQLQSPQWSQSLYISLCKDTIWTHWTESLRPTMMCLLLFHLSLFDTMTLPLFPSPSEACEI